VYAVFWIEPLRWPIAREDACEPHAIIGQAAVSLQRSAWIKLLRRFGQDRGGTDWTIGKGCTDRADRPRLSALFSDDCFLDDGLSAPPVADVS
jgi:hypothetical protein